MRVKNILFLSLFILLFNSCSNTGSPQPEKKDPFQVSNLSERPTEATLFSPGLISTFLYERDIAISPEGNEIIYTLGTFDQSVRALVTIRKEKGEWKAGEVMNFSGEYQDIEPFFSLDGKQLFFASNRPVYGDTARTDYNIWVTRRAREGGWEEPEALPEFINTAGDEFYPSVSQNGNLYFTAIREDGIGSEDIFMSRFENGNYSEPVVLGGGVNTKTYEFNAYINPDEDLLIFGSFGREDGFGGGDLYYSKKNEDGVWMDAVNMGEKVNSEHLDYCPFIDQQNANFYFTSDRPGPSAAGVKNPEEIEQLSMRILNGFGNIYRIGLDELGQEFK